jgi:hypothetical protein
MYQQVHCAKLEVIRIWTLHRVYMTVASSSSGVVGGGGAPAPPRQWAPRRQRRLRDPTTASASAASAALPRRRRCCSGRQWRVPPTSAAQLCCWGPSLATAWPWLTDHHHPLIPSGTATFCRILNTLAIHYLCHGAAALISIAILQPGPGRGGAHNFI